MKTILILFFTLFIVNTTFAQVTLDKNTKKGIEIKADDVSATDDSEIIQPKAEPKPRVPENPNPPQENKPFSMLDDSGLLDAGEELQKKWDLRDKKILNAYQEDQYLGSFSATGTFLSIECRDHEFVDGDRVQIAVNGILVEPNLLLSGNYRGINADLIKGKNVIEFIALNQGLSGPNTAKFRVLADDGHIITAQEWNLLTGVRASLIVFKD